MVSNPPSESDVLETWLGHPISFQEILKRLHPTPGSLLGDLESIMERIEKGVDAEVSRQAESIAQRLQDPRLHSLFLGTWAWRSADSGRLTEAESLLQRAQDLLPKNVPFEFLAVIELGRSAILFWKENLLQARELNRRTIENCPRRSPRRLFWLYMFAWDLAGYGRLAEFPEWPGEGRRGDAPSNDREDMLLTNFVNAVQTGALLQARTMAPTALNALGHIPRHWQIPIRYHLDLLSLQKGLWVPSSATRQDPLPPGILEVHYRLTLGKPQEALACARTIEIDSKNLIWAQYGWTTLLRAELACGNHLAARRLLDKERERSGEHYLDDLFLARMERLAGHSEEAQKHFARLLERIAFYKAEGRLDFELKMACELPSRDVFRWMQAAYRAKPALSPAPLPTTSRPEPATFQGVPRMIGTSPALEGIRKLIRDVASHKAPVLITGETGTGKDLVARAIHHEGSRQEEPFLAVNCSGITESLLASELFGHVKGAFTGAEKDRPGLFEQAGKGTLFLDEIGDISPGLQVALLRVLDQGEIRPVGADRDKKIRCRIVAATNADLEQKVKAGSFREDLLFRLQRLTIHIPPLRERKQDVRDLTMHFLDEGRPEGMHAAVSDDLSTLFAGYAWPGNVRELRNTIERMRVLNSDGLRYEAGSLDPTLRLRLQNQASAEAIQSPGAVQTRATGTATDTIRAFIKASRSPLRRRERIKELFQEHKTLTPAEVRTAMGVSALTTLKDLKTLCTEGFLRKMEHSHYYTLRT